MSLRASIVGASGYTGGEIMRLLTMHPEVEIGQITSRSLADKPVHVVHPHLRGHMRQSFSLEADLEPCDVLFLCLPHGVAAGAIERYRAMARIVVDLSSDFRLRDAKAYEHWYGQAHTKPEMLAEAVYGLPELSRAALPGATLISGVGCNATAMNLALLPLARAGLIERAIADVKVGSSEAGAEPGPGSHHPTRSRAVRTYSPSGHRHLAEVQQALGPIDIDATITAIEMVRGVLATIHVLPTRKVEQKELWSLYREAYAKEPFVRIVSDRTGAFRLPDPKILAGCNDADVGFAIDEGSGRIIALCAIDNLMKGAAGSAVQAMNVALGLDESLGLGAPGVHPV
ncbi:MAG: N-acetyl-gamma-glutamyl-phosphate reductase [Phycisphaeraceae bacterium]|nr:N-acetyl-gamma-glutamyl-phosphate reductase [Phycisphaeraceae bacterium]MCW5762080.1 N-acetyl-gamma-glutamyl-phosphate reductase [Phycisphaeraceae bacterium]